MAGITGKIGRAGTRLWTGLGRTNRRLGQAGSVRIGRGDKDLYNCRNILMNTYGAKVIRTPHPESGEAYYAASRVNVAERSIPRQDQSLAINWIKIGLPLLIILNFYQEDRKIEAIKYVSGERHVLNELDLAELNEKLESDAKFSAVAGHLRSMKATLFVKLNYIKKEQ